MSKRGSIKLWRDLKPGMIVLPTKSSADRCVGFRMSDGTRTWGGAHRIKRVTVLDNYTSPTFFTKRHALCLVLLPETGHPFIITTESVLPLQWWVIA